MLDNLLRIQAENGKSVLLGVFQSDGILEVKYRNGLYPVSIEKLIKALKEKSNKSA